MQCPVCRADVMHGPQCRRCRADLTLLFALEEQRCQALAVARRSLADGNTDAALAHVQRVLELRPDEEARRLLASIYLVRRDFAQALATYQNATLSRARSAAE